jgi:hypothetical protein
MDVKKITIRKLKLNENKNHLNISYIVNRNITAIAKRNYKFLAYIKLENRVMVFNITFNNISIFLWRSVLLVEETGVLRENHRKSLDNLVLGKALWS